MKERDWTILSWSEMTWSERSKSILFELVAPAPIALIIAVVAIVSVGEFLDGITRYRAEVEHCLQNATNGYEIEQCR